MKILVTGGAGFIGSHITDALLMLGHEVTILDRIHPKAHAGLPDYLNPGAEHIWADLNDPGVAEKAAEGVEAVFHQAAMVGLGVSFDDIADYVADNDMGTAMLLKALAARGFTGRFILASSMVVYGEGAYRCDRHGAVHPGPRLSEDLAQGSFEVGCPDCAAPLEPVALTEEAPTDPRNIYAATKLHQEHLCKLFGSETGAPVTVLRYHNVYGPRAPFNTPYSGVASIFRSALESKESPQVFEDGGQLRDFVHVSDVARANIAALTCPDPKPGVFNVASGQRHTIGEMAEALSQAFGGKHPPRLTGRYRSGDVRHIIGSSEKARTAFGFEPQVQFNQGMHDFATAPLRARAPD